MIGTIINIIAIVVGGTLGMFFGSRLSNDVKKTVTSGMGLFVVALGIKMFLDTENSLIVLGALLIGALLGEWWQIEEGFQKLGVFLEKKFAKGDGSADDSRFVRGFLTASLLFCIGPISIIGSIQDGMSGDYSLLAVKSVLDAFASLAFASTLGIGVLFSALPILVYQGGISLAAVQLNALLTEPMMLEMTATGGVILFGLGVSNLLEIKKIRIGSFLPALAIAPLIVYLLSLLS